MATELRIALSELVRAAAIDAGNANMRKHNRKRWNKDDYAAASKEGERLANLIPGWTETNPIDCRPRT